MIRVGTDHFASTPRFVIRRELGAGGMGVVFEAFDTEREATVAIKTLPDATSVDLYRFKNEFRSLANLAHPNLVILHELISDGSRWFFSMEFVEGVNFLEYVRPDPWVSPADPSSTLDLDATHHTSRGDRTLSAFPETVDYQLPTLPRDPLATRTHTFDLDRTEDVDATRELPGYVADRKPVPSGADTFDEPRLRSALVQIVKGIDALHRAGYLHRDLKPSNVMVDRGGRLVILDFGLVSDLTAARRPPEPSDSDSGLTSAHNRLSTAGNSDSGDFTDANLILGTAAYMSPEQAGSLPLSPATDWYSLGVMLYSALTGILPYTGKFHDVLRNKRKSPPERPDRVAANVPADLNALCMDLMGIDPASRPVAAEILERLGESPSGRSGEVAAHPAGDRSIPLVGREDHVTALEAALGEVVAGRTIALFLHGRSGAGKSILVQRFLDELEAKGQAVILRGRCYETESVPYKAMDALVDDVSRFLNRIAEEELETLIPDEVAALANVFPVLLRVGAIADAPGWGLQQIEPRELRRKAFRAFRTLLDRIGSRTHLVLWIDDLQWGDLDSATILTELLSGHEPPRFLLLACYRSEYAETSACLKALMTIEPRQVPRSRFRTVAVEPLRPDESHALALALLNGMGSHEVAAAIARESQGSPLFIHELVRHVRGGQSLPDTDGSSAPIELDAVLWGRVRGLPDPARALLEVVAVAGQPTIQQSAIRAAGLQGDDLSTLHLLRAELLIRTSGPRPIDEVETYHDRVRESILARLDPEVRVAHHRQLATTLEKAGNSDPQTLAFHFESARDGQSASHHYALAADEAANALAFDRAAKLYQKALDLGLFDDPAAIQALRGRHADALANAGRGAEAAERYLVAAETASGGEKIELERRAAYQFCISGRTDEGRSVLETVLDRVGMTLPSTPGRTLVSLLLGRLRLKLRGLNYRPREVDDIRPAELTRIDVAWAATAGLSMFDILGGADFQTRNLLLSLRAGESTRIARALAWEAAHAALAGGPGESRTVRLLEISRSLAVQSNQAHALGMVAMAEGTRYYFVGRWHDARAHLEKAESIFRQRCTGVIWELDSALAFLIWSLVFGGELAEMRKRAAVILQDAEERGDLYAAATQGAFCEPLIKIMAGDVAGARDSLRHYQALYPHRGYHAQDMLALMASVQVEIYDGRGRAAWDDLHKQWPDLTRSRLLSFQLLRLHMLQHRARAALAASHLEQDAEPFIRAAERDIGSIEKERMPWSNACARLLRAGCLARRGDLAASQIRLRDAIIALDDVGMPQYAASARYRLGEILGGAEGEAMIGRAVEWMRSQGIVDPGRMVAVFAPGFALTANADS